MSRTAPDRLSAIAAKHPRLMATAAAIVRTRAFVQGNATARRWFAEVEKQAIILVGLPPLDPAWVHDPRETESAPLPLVEPPKSPDGPAAPLDIARLFCLRVLTLGLMWLLTGETRYRDRAKAELFAVCAFPDWTGDKFLVTAETAFGAAIGYDWLFDSLTVSERDRIAQAIVDKAVRPGLAQFAAPSPPYWTTTAMNWNLVCNGALMIAALAVLESGGREAAELFRLCRASVPVGLREYRPDGGWVEGPGYWHYATQYAIYLLDSLETALGTDLGLDGSPGLSRTGFFRLHAAGPSGKLFNFADSADAHSGGYWLLWLAKRFHHPIDAWIEQQQRKIHPMDLLWFDETARGPLDLPEGARFRAAGVVMLRGDWRDPDTTYLGIKGGANDACEHGHYDLGSFVLDCRGVRWAMDLGPDDYGLPGYFKPQMRSRYYRTATIGHNTLVIDGECQPATARARIVGLDLRAAVPWVTIDLSAAYPGCRHVARGFAMIERRHVLVVDEIVPDKSLSSVDWQMHTAASVDLSGDIAALAFPIGEDAARFYLRVLEPATAKFLLVQAAPSGPAGQNPNTGVAKLILRAAPAAQPLRLAILLSPDRDFCADPRLPPGLQRPLADWAVPPATADQPDARPSADAGSAISTCGTPQSS